jgi:diguanylate cyclase (GGDEF)-like protein
MNLPLERIQRVIVIEDDDGDALLVERALARSEFKTVRAPDRQSALNLLAEGGIDAALLDLSLPDSFGLEGVDALMALFPDLPLVVVTGQDDSALALASLQHGAQDYLHKCDWTPSLLVRTLRYAIQRQQLRVDKRLLMEELARQARQDSLTGLLNRRSFLEEFEREWSRACRGAGPLSCVMLDIDYFKKVNDGHGHAAGDAVLKAIAQIVRLECRPTDVAGRYGGEEFCVLLPDTTEESAVVWAERTRRRIAETSIAAGDGTLSVTASFGLAERCESTQAPENLIDQADQALRLAKQLGRDRVLATGSLGRTTAAGFSLSQNLFANAQAGDLLSPVVATLPPTALLDEAAQFLVGSRVDCLPVVDDEGNLLGIISEAEVSATLTVQRNWSKCVADVMTKKPPCFGAWVDAEAIRDFLARSGARCVLIVEGQKPIGTVSQFGILRWLAWQAAAPVGARAQARAPHLGQGVSTAANVTATAAMAPA